MSNNRTTTDNQTSLEPNHHHVEQQWALRDSLPMWTVCRPTTSDFAGQWTARMNLTLPAPRPTDLLIVAATLEPGLTNIGRQPGDDPVIEEVWL
jgi:hypothetical protein